MRICDVAGCQNEAVREIVWEVESPPIHTTIKMTIDGVKDRCPQCAAKALAEKVGLRALGPDENHCKDCCCAQAWDALNISDYTGTSIPEHITALLRERDELRARVSELEASLSNIADSWRAEWKSRAKKAEAQLARAKPVIEAAEKVGRFYRNGLAVNSIHPECVQSLVAAVDARRAAMEAKS